MMSHSCREDEALTKDLGLWSQRRQLHRGRAEWNKVQRPSMYTNLVNGNWLLLVTRTGPRKKSSGFSIKQCQIFLFSACRMNSLILPVVLMNVCHCLFLLLVFLLSFSAAACRGRAMIFSTFLFIQLTTNKTRIDIKYMLTWIDLNIKSV